MGTRILDLGAVSPVESQAIYHALGRSVSAGQDDTVVLARPSNPYACLGYHVSSAAVDFEYCKRHGLPVIRRRIGGGLVYLDSDQLFVQFCVDDLPRAMDRAYPTLMEPLVATLEELEVSGGLSDSYDLTANGSKVGGIGGGRLGEASVITTNFIFEFDWERATGIHATPSPAFRDRLRESMEHNVTSLARECTEMPNRRQVRDILHENFKDAFPDPYRDDLTDRERKLVSEEARKLDDEEFLYLRDDVPDERRVKVSDGVFLRVVRARIDGRDGRVLLEAHDGRTTHIEALGDEQLADPERFLDRDAEAVVQELSVEA